MNNNICLNPDIKWHGRPRVIKLSTAHVELEEKDGYMLARITAAPKKMSRKRLIKLLMAHGIYPRYVRRVVDQLTREGRTHTDIYRIVIGVLEKFINEKTQRVGEDDKPDKNA